MKAKHLLIEVQSGIIQKKTFMKAFKGTLMDRTFKKRQRNESKYEYVAHFKLL